MADATQPTNIPPIPSTSSENTAHGTENQVLQSNQISQANPQTSTYSSANSHPNSQAQPNGTVVHSSAAPNLGQPSNGLVNTTRKTWLAWELGIYFFILMLILEIGFICTLIVTLIISQNKNGLKTINTSNPINISNSFLSATIFDPSSAYSLLWTFLPSTILSNFSLLWGLVVTAFGARQPFVTMFKQNGGPARKTILLDYNADGGIWGFLNGTIVRNRHWAFSIATLLSFIASLILAPLGSHAYQPKSVLFSSDISLTYSKSFVDYTIDTPNLAGPFAIASAVVTYNSTPPPWMDSLFAYAPFSYTSKTSNGSIVVNTTAYSASLDCEILGPDDYTSTSTEQGQSLDITDRGCSTNVLLGTLNSNNTLSRVYYTLSCSNETGLARIGLTAAIGANLADFTIVSCIPSYWTLKGNLTVNLRPGNDPLVGSFQNSTDWIMSQPQPVYAVSLESNLGQYSFIDPTQNLAVNQFGLMIYEFSSSISSSNPLDSASLKEGMERIFPSIHAAFVTQSLFVPSAESTQIGTLKESVTRIVVVMWTCILLIVLLAFVMVSNVWLFVNTRRGIDTMLPEEPVGLLAMAGLAYDSRAISNSATNGIPGFIQKFQRENPGVKGIRETVINHYSIDNSRCQWDDQLGIIKVENLNRRGPA